MKKISVFFIPLVIFTVLIETAFGRTLDDKQTSNKKVRVVDKTDKSKIIRKPDEKTWNSWIQKLKDNYQEKFSPPSATSYIYLKKEKEEAWIDETHSYTRWVSEKCGNCRYKVRKVRGKKILLIDQRTKQSMEMVSNRGNQVFGKESLFILVFDKLPDNEVRLFLHDLSLKNLKKKRERHFYEYNGKAIWPGHFYWLKKPKSVTFQRSDGSKKEVSVMAKIRYKKEKQEGHLSVYGFGDNNWYGKQTEVMLLFRDYSNGKKTYGSGRFLNLFLPKPMGKLKDGDKVSVDFNFAYNPPCAVSTGFHCPLPQDLVETEILTGESYKKIKN